MSNFENAQNLNNPELNAAKVQADVSAGKKLEGKITPKELEELKTEEGKNQEPKKQRLSPEGQLKNLEGEMETQQQEMNILTKYIKETKGQLNKIREELGLPPLDKEEPPSIFLEKDRLKKLKAKQEALEKQKEDLISQQEKEQLIRKEKEKILQEKLDELFKEFEVLNPRDFESILKSGQTPEKRNIESKSMGSLDPEVAQPLAKAFKEGIRLLPKILEASPELLKKFDEVLTEEATKRADKKLEEEKQKIRREQKEEKPKELNLEEEPKIFEDEIPPSEVSPEETNPAEGGSAKRPKV